MEATLQNVFKLSYGRYKEHHGVSFDQHEAANTIMTCYNTERGYEKWICQDDGHIEQQAHSCRHRSCPRYQSAYTQAWLDKTQARLLPCDHYHVIFTLPHKLNEIWQYNREWSAGHLFKASAETLRQLLKDDRYLGAAQALWFFWPTVAGRKSSNVSGQHLNRTSPPYHTRRMKPRTRLRGTQARSVIRA